MTAWVVLTTPLALLVLVLLLGFVACDLDIWTGPPTQLASDLDVFDLPGVIAFWRLDDGAGATVVKDWAAADNQAGPNVGTVTPLSGPAVYDTAHRSAAVPGIVTGGSGRIAQLGGATCFQFDGGFVSVAFDPTLNLPTFSIVVAVSPDWPADPAHPAFRVVVQSGQAEGSGTAKGFVLRSNLADQWEVGIGIGGTAYTLVTGPAVTARNATNMLVVTFDGTTLSLFVDSVLAVSTPAGGTYLPAAASDLRIGSGALKAIGGNPGRPIWPFEGRIASVALYDRALTQADIDGLSIGYLGT